MLDGFEQTRIATTGAEIHLRKAGQGRPLGNSPSVGAYKNVGGSFAYVFNRRPHPNAFRVFVNWVMTKEVQTGMSRAMGQDSRRVDVSSVAEAERTPIAGATYIEPQREPMAKKVRAAMKYIKGVRAK